jgi:hypothetical protein
MNWQITKEVVDTHGQTNPMKFTSTWEDVEAFAGDQAEVEARMAELTETQGGCFAATLLED